MSVIQGVHAQSVVFVDLKSIVDLLEHGLWPGPHDYGSTTERNFRGTRPDRLIVRISGIRSAKRMARCSFQLASREERFKAKVRGTLEFTAIPMKGRTKVILQGLADRDLAGKTAPTEAVRGVANEYVRQLLDEIATRLEELAKGEPVKAATGS